MTISCRTWVPRRVLRLFGVFTIALCALLGPGLKAALGQMKVLTSTSEVTVYEESDALLISASAYSNSTAWPRLTTVPTELQNVADALRAQGFAVATVANPNADGLIRSVREFLLKARKPKSRALVYFSGHGWTDESGIGYIVGADAPAADKRDFKTRVVSMEVMRAFAKDSTARHTLFVFDSCYSGSIFTSRGNEPIRAVTLEELQRPATQFLSSGSAKQRVPSQSPFATAFVDAINGSADYNNDGLVQASEIALYVQTVVSRYSAQTPQFGYLGENGGHVIFRPNRTPVFANGPPLSLPALPPPTNDRPGATAPSAVDTTTAANVLPAQTDAQIRLKDVDFRRGTDGSGILVVDLTSAQAGVDVRRQGQSLEVDFLRSTLPDRLRRRINVTDFGTPVRSVSALQEGDRVRLLVDSTGNWTHSSHHTDNRFVLEVRPLKGSPSSTSTAKLQEPRIKNEKDAKSTPGLLPNSEGVDDFRVKYPNTQVFYYRKGSDGTAILDLLNTMKISYIARPAELSDAYPSNALGCGPRTDLNALKALGLRLLEGGFRLQAVYTYVQPELKRGRVQITAYSDASNNPPLSRSDIESMTACPKKLIRGAT